MIGKKLKALRRKHNRITQSQLAEVLGVTQQAVGLWERDQNMPEAAMLIKIAKYFNVSLDELLETKKVTLTLDTQRRIKKEPVYYTDPETAELANEIKDNPELRMLFDVSRHAKKADILTGIRIMKGFLDND